MKRVYYDKENFMVSQIFDLTNEPELIEELNEYSFFYCNMVDIEDEVEIGYNYKFDVDTEKFVIDSNYVEPNSQIEPSEVEVLEKKTENLETELFLTQSAVDFLLMSSVSEVNTLNTKNIKTKGENSIMAGYLSMRIIKGMLSYKEVVARYPEYKDEIDFILKAEGKGDLIVA